MIFNPKFNVNGQVAWMLMELVSPYCLLRTYLSAPGRSSPSIVPLPSTLLLFFFLAHYANRAVINPIRSPSRSEVHIAIPIIAAVFNYLNGSLIGAWLAFMNTALPVQVTTKWFWIGLGGAVVGMVSNIWHDELLMRLRDQRKEDGENRYKIPYGGLFRFVSYPNYLSEWFEWLSFAIACSTLFAASPLAPWTMSRMPFSWKYFPLNPPWAFLINEVATMLPRAISGHRWYKTKFDNYPKERKAVIPFLL